MKQFLKKYSHIWVASYLLIYLPWYFGLQNNSSAQLFDVYTKIDAMIPFVSWFIYPYVYWFLFVFMTVVYLFFRDNKKQFYQFIGYLFLGMSICCVIFTIFPNGFDHRPTTFVASSLETMLLNFIYSSDKAMNVFPSIHVYNSIVCAIALLHCDEFKGNHGMKIFAIGSAVLISLSTMLIKQHSILDVIAAIVLATILYPLFYKKKA